MCFARSDLESHLLHWETLLVVTTGDAEHVALEVITEDVALNLVGHTLVVEVTKLGLVINLVRTLQQLEPAERACTR